MAWRSSTRTSGWRVVVSASTLLVALLLAASAWAEETVVCEIRTILGRDSKGGIDPKLASLKRQLKKPPFTAFGSFALLETKRLTIGQRKIAQTKLPTKKLLRLTFKERLLAAKKQVRLRMHLSITPPRALGYLPGTLFTINDGGTLLVAGDPHAGGTLIVGVTCKSQ